MASSLNVRWSEVINGLVRFSPVSRSNTAHFCIFYPAVASDRWHVRRSTNRQSINHLNGQMTRMTWPLYNVPAPSTATVLLSCKGRHEMALIHEYFPGRLHAVPQLATGCSRLARRDRQPTITLSMARSASAQPGGCLSAGGQRCRLCWTANCLPFT